MTNEWRKCRKKVVVHFREVHGEKERVNTREGITWAYAATDYVMKGSQDELYPIKKDIFAETYEVIDE